MLVFSKGKHGTGRPPGLETGAGTHRSRPGTVQRRVTGHDVQY